MVQMGSAPNATASRQQQQFASVEANLAPRRVIAPAPAPVVAPRTRLAGLRARLSGPGGLYNAGNAIGLLSGLALAVVAAGASDLRGDAQAIWDHLAGSASAVCITLAMAIFFWSGEAYHRAWSRGAPPDARLNRIGDLSSGWGALALGAGLFLVGEPLLAATAGLLHAFGKFGSALARGRFALGPFPGAFRTAVLVSRFPAIALVIAQIAAAAGGETAPQAADLAGPALLLLCYLIWARADVMLMRS
jgi:hypothetical protein